MSLPFLFLAASIAICAMILPGISGAYVLLVLGVYHPITGLVKNLAKLQVTLEGLVQMTVFALGCAVWPADVLEDPASTLAAITRSHDGSLDGTDDWQRWQALAAADSPRQRRPSLEPKFRVMEYVSPADWTGSIPMLVMRCTRLGGRRVNHRMDRHAREARVTPSR